MKRDFMASMQWFAVLYLPILSNLIVWGVRQAYFSVDWISLDITIVIDLLVLAFAIIVISTIIAFLSHSHMLGKANLGFLLLASASIGALTGSREPLLQHPLPYDPFREWSVK